MTPRAYGLVEGSHINADPHDVTALRPALLLIASRELAKRGQSEDLSGDVLHDALVRWLEASHREVFDVFIRYQIRNLARKQARATADVMTRRPLSLEDFTE